MGRSLLSAAWRNLLFLWDALLTGLEEMQADEYRRVSEEFERRGLLKEFEALEKAKERLR